MGSSLAAFIAGIRPAMHPVITLKEKPIIMEVTVIIGGVVSGA